MGMDGDGWMDEDVSRQTGHWESCGYSWKAANRLKRTTFLDMASDCQPPLPSLPYPSIHFNLL